MKSSGSSREVDKLVEAWFKTGGRDEFYDAITDQPEIAWLAILEISRRNLSEDQEALLAAGPLEDLLASHGEKYIAIIEREAINSARFNHLLGGVWRQGMSAQVWERVQKVRKDVW